MTLFICFLIVLPIFQALAISKLKRRIILQAKYMKGLEQEIEELKAVNLQNSMEDIEYLCEKIEDKFDD